MGLPELMLLSSSHEVRHSLFACAFSLKARQSQPALSYLAGRAPRPKGLYLCLDQDPVRLSLTHISTFRGKFDVSRRFDQEFAFACHSHTQPCGQRRGGLSPVLACSQGFRPRRAQHPSPAWSGSNVVGVWFLEERYSITLHGARSNTLISSIFPASTKARVRETSSGEGVTSPEG